MDIFTCIFLHTIRYIHDTCILNNLKGIIHADVIEQCFLWKLRIMIIFSFRNREVDSLKQEIQQLKARRDPHPATIHDLENVCIYVVSTKLDLSWKFVLTDRNGKIPTLTYQLIGTII